MTTPLFGLRLSSPQDNNLDYGGTVGVWCDTDDFLIGGDATVKLLCWRFVPPQHSFDFPTTMVVCKNFACKTCSQTNCGPPVNPARPEWPRPIDRVDGFNVMAFSGTMERNIIQTQLPGGEFTAKLYVSSEPTPDEIQIRSELESLVQGGEFLFHLYTVADPNNHLGIDQRVICIPVAPPL